MKCKFLRMKNFIYLLEDDDGNEDADSETSNKGEASGVIKTHEVDKVIDKMNSLNEMFGKLSSYN